MQKETKTIILFGYPRSGTTWISEVLASGELTYLHEPDNERININGLLVKKGGARFEILDTDKKIAQLFEDTLSGKFISHKSKFSTYPLTALGYSPLQLETFINAPKVVAKSVNQRKLKLLKTLFKVYLTLGIARNKAPFLIKSVHSGLLLHQFLSNEKLHFKPIITLRHPAAVIKSMQTLNNKDIYRSIEKDPGIGNIIPQELLPELEKAKTPLQKAALQIGIHHYYWHQLAKEKNLIVIKHESFLLNPKDEFKKLYKSLKMNYTDRVERIIDEKNKTGSGYATARNATDLIDAWKGYFSESELEEIKFGYQLLPNSQYVDFSNIK